MSAPLLPARLLLVAFLGGCSSVGLVPIQLARTTQLETYEQTFYFRALETAGDLSRTGDLEPHIRVTREIDATFGALVGQENWQLIKDKYGFAPLRDELIAHELRLRGILTSLLSVDAFDRDRFYFEGSGRFFLVRGPSREILLNGDFVVVPRTYAIASLAQEDAAVDVDIMLFISRIPGAITRFNDARVRYRIKVDSRRAASQVFSLAYDEAHPVFLLERDPTGATSERLIGHLRFDAPVGDRKLIDLRGRRFLRSDYAPKGAP